MINKYALQHMDGELTIFAPSNDAMKRYKGEPDEQFVLNHMGKNADMPIKRVLKY